MEEGDDGTFKFCTPTGIDRCWGESFPDDGFTDVGSNEKGDSRTKTVTFLKKLIEKDDDKSGRYKLYD